MIQKNPRNWRVLGNGSATQRKAFEIISESRIFDILAPFDPAHVGTIGDDIDVEGSDIDIICSASNLNEIEAVLECEFGTWEGFSVEKVESRGATALVANIPTEIAIEIYAEATPVNEQLGYRHYMIACRILEIGGEALHAHIRDFKLKGIKTEPAFALYLGLSGDPYLTLLTLEYKSDQTLKGILVQQGLLKK